MRGPVAARWPGKDFLAATIAAWMTTIALVPAQNAAAADEELLRPEDAFRYEATANDGTVVVDWTIAPGYYLYRSRMSYASKTPGRTQLLNFFELSERASDGTRVARAYAVDLPGYGFAKIDASKRATWDELAGGYLATRRYLVGVVLVMDARRPLTPADEALLAWLVQRAPAAPPRVHLLLNKSDQLNRAERAAALRLVERRIETLPLDAGAQTFSARTREGLDDLRAAVERTIAEARPG